MVLSGPQLSGPQLSGVDVATALAGQISPQSTEPANSGEEAPMGSVVQDGTVNTGLISSLIRSHGSCVILKTSGRGMPTTVRQGQSHQRSEQGGGAVTLRHAEVPLGSQPVAAGPLHGETRGAAPQGHEAQPGRSTSGSLNTDCSEVGTSGLRLHKGAWLRGT